MAHGVSEPPPTTPLSFFCSLLRAREAAPGTSWPKMEPPPIRKNDKICPWEHFGRFLIILGRSLANRKHMFFSTGAEIDNIRPGLEAPEACWA